MKIMRRSLTAMLAMTVLLSMFGPAAWGASTRFAVITESSGTVTMTKSGGTKEVKVFIGMGLNEGDSLKVGSGSSVTLKVADREDEIVLGQNWSGTVSQLKSSNGGTQTAVKTWGGSMFSKVNKLSNSGSSYRVETPTAVMGVRGTHYTVAIDPVTGLMTMFVHSGQVQADSGNVGPLILPTQQISASPYLPIEETDNFVVVMDTEQLLQVADNDVIRKILMSKSEIDQENQELLDNLNLENGASASEGLSEEQFERFRSNVENGLFHILDRTADMEIFSAEELQRIIDEVNEELQTERQYDLSRELRPLDPTAGVDPQQQQRRLQLERQVQEELQEQQERRREQQAANASLINQLQQQIQQQQQQNQQMERQRSQEAIDRYRAQMSEEARRQLQQRMENLQNSTRTSETPQATQPGGGGGSDSDDSDNTLPQPSIALSKTDTPDGFNVKVTADNFNGSNAFYGMQLHFVHDTNLMPETHQTHYYNSAVVGSSEAVDNLRPVIGTVTEGTATKEKVETIYALTLMNSASGMEADGNEWVIDIPFVHHSGSGETSGTLKLSYVSFVDSSGSTLFTLTNSQLAGSGYTLSYTIQTN